MLKPFTIAALFVTTSAVALPTYACDRHGGGFGFGNPNTNWQSYNPRTSTIDPTFLDQDAEGAPLITPVPAEKARPSFSNAANRAAVIAKSRVARKTKNETSKESEEKLVKKAALILDADR